MPNETEKITVNSVTIDTEKANRILQWLILREAENVRTKARNEGQMIADIQKKIKEEAECY
ncbi:MAG: hypothetical protein GX804_03425 [Lentisphaerae bacterium]|jgi:hypothetical protein|nr:hypothetical protein [Lentisphaerota bacterium]